MVRSKPLSNIFVLKNPYALPLSYDEAKQKKYKEVYIMCLKDGESCDDVLKERWSKAIINKFNLIKSPLIAVSRRDIGILEIETVRIKKYFPNVDDLSAHILVFPLFILETNNVELYNRQFHGLSTVNEVLRLYTVNHMMKRTGVHYADHQVRLDMIRSMTETKFWMIPINCGHNINLQFSSRSFNLTSIADIQDPELKNMMVNIEQNAYVLNTKKRHTFVDPSLSVTEKGYRLYRISNAPNINLDAFQSIMKNLLSSNLKEAYFLVMYTLASKDYCHLVLNSMDILNNCISQHSFINVFSHKLRYVMSYAWLTMYMEESIKKSYLVNEDRCIFTADVASKLPMFPFDPFNHHTSPYLPVLISKKKLNVEKNIMGVNLMASCCKEIGVVDSATFKVRLNIFLMGDNIDVFKGMDWTSLGLTGSTMAACLPRFNPLIRNHDNDLNRFFRHAYADADVDIMITEKGFRFVDKVFHIYDTIQTNIKKINPDEMVNINFKKTVTIVSTVPMSLDEAYDKYLQFMTKYCETEADKLANPQYEAIKHIVDKSEVKVIIREKNDKPFLVFGNIKYKVSSKSLLHDLELFSVTLKPIAVVARFYLPIVRAYYDGSQVYMTPSCISACMTLINIDYRYFAGTKDPIEVVNKYRVRGFSIYLNSQEMKRYVAYTKESPKWSQVFISQFINHNFKKGYIPLRDRVFINGINPPVNFYQFYEQNKTYCNIFMEMYPLTNINIINDINSTAISEEGYTTPLKSRIIENIDFSTLKH